MARMYNQTGNLYQGVFDCLFKTIRTEGVLAIYKGFFAHLARILPHTVSLTHLGMRLRNINPMFLDFDPQSGRADQQADAPRRGSHPSGLFPWEDLVNEGQDRILLSSAHSGSCVASKDLFSFLILLDMLTCIE
jgi:hypothetical protein